MTFVAWTVFWWSCARPPSTATWLRILCDRCLLVFGSFHPLSFIYLVLLLWHEDGFCRCRPLLLSHNFCFLCVCVCVLFLFVVSLPTVPVCSVQITLNSHVRNLIEVIRITVIVLYVCLSELGFKYYLKSFNLSHFSNPFIATDKHSWRILTFFQIVFWT